MKRENITELRITRAFDDCTVINNEAIDDKDLSNAALGLLVRMYRGTEEAGIAVEESEALRELINSGYVTIAGGNA